MGKILIIKGASYTPPADPDLSGSGNTGSGNGDDNPSLSPVIPYKLYYLKSGTWQAALTSSSSSGTITAVGVVIPDIPSSGITGVAADLAAIPASLKVLFVTLPTLKLSGNSFADPSSAEYVTAVNLESSMELSQYAECGSFLIWIGTNPGVALSAAEVDAIVNAVPDAIAFNY